MIRKLLKPFIRNNDRRFYKKSSDSIIAKASRFIACEMIEGDYLEFGVYQGASFISSYCWLNHQFHSRSSLDVGGVNQDADKNHRMSIWNNMRFFAFDSFEGLPELSVDDKATHDFQKGQYACSAEKFRDNVIAKGVPEQKLHLVKGFFDKTCTEETHVKHKLEKASIIWIDADLFSSTRDVLAFITPLIQDGTVIVFDDWFSFRGNPKLGIQKAFYEWSCSLGNTFVFTEYQRDSWKRMSFIASIASPEP